MDKKFKIFFAVLLAIALLLPGAALSKSGNGAIKYKAVIADNPGDDDIKSFEVKGCKMKRHFKSGAALDCPEDVVPTLNVREDRIFNIVDFNADVQTGADLVWADGVDGTDVIVAVLDTGIDYTHPQLADSYIPSESYDFYNMDAYPMDDHGHGTHVSGIITANTGSAKGVAPGAKIIMYKVCNSRGQCPESAMLAAMERAANSSARIMSISIGGGGTTAENCDGDPLAAKVNWVVSHGITAFVAAGNDGATVSTPGCASGAVAVGAVNNLDDVVYFSGRGLALDILAPGYNIYSTLVGGYGYMSGTSMATPHAAGVGALLLDANPSLSTAQIKDAIYTTADPASRCYSPSGAEVACTVEITGHGVVDAYGAYLAVKPAPQTCTADSQCNDNVSCTDDVCSVAGSCTFTPNDGLCPADGWADTANTRWVTSGICAEKEQVLQESRNYYCSATSGCQYTASSTQWIDTGTARTAPDGTACEDGLFCNTGDMCLAGVCGGGTARTCDDSNSCTTNTCNETTDACVFTAIPDCGPCWTSAYLVRDSNQARKFCKCAEGRYGYKTYTYVSGTRSANRYNSSADNLIWGRSTVTSTRPISRVKCMDNAYYSTSASYYY